MPTTPPTTLTRHSCLLQATPPLHPIPPPARAGSQAGIPNKCGRESSSQTALWKSDGSWPQQPASIRLPERLDRTIRTTDRSLHPIEGLFSLVCLSTHLRFQPAGRDRFLTQHTRKRDPKDGLCLSFLHSLSSALFLVRLNSIGAWCPPSKYKFPICLYIASTHLKPHSCWCCTESRQRARNACLVPIFKFEALEHVNTQKITPSKQQLAPNQPLYAICPTSRFTGYFKGQGDET